MSQTSLAFDAIRLGCRMKDTFPMACNIDVESYSNLTGSHEVWFFEVPDNFMNFEVPISSSRDSDVKSFDSSNHRALMLSHLEGHPRCSQAKGSKVEERLVQLRMEVRFEVLIKKKKMYYLGLRRFDLWMEFLMVHLEELGLRK
ncbi:hypothetical protein Tco_0981050 [Tanacetum coccineum]